MRPYYYAAPRTPQRAHHAGPPAEHTGQGTSRCPQDTTRPHGPLGEPA